MRRIISDCFSPGERLYDGEPIIEATSEIANLVELVNGVTLESMDDGRYYDSQNDLRRFAQVLDWDDEADCGVLIGYVEL